ncbi:MAG TPA: hypothetical protein VIX42_09325 [Edaphobacter sp.]
MVRRLFLSRLAQLAAVPLVVAGGSVERVEGQATHKSLKILMKSAWGSDDPTKAGFPFLHGLASRKPDMKCRFSCWERRLY